MPGSGKLDAVWPYVLLGLKLIPFYIWFAIFTLQPHKEERFLYVAYPFITLNAAISIFLLRGWASRAARALGAKVNFSLPGIMERMPLKRRGDDYLGDGACERDPLCFVCHSCGL